MVAAMVFLGCAALLLISAWLVPSDSGVGTHRQLGLPPCATLALTGIPCPSCGMTTAFAHTVRGELVAAFRSQPAGLLLALGTALAGTLGLYSLMTGRVWMLNWYRVSPVRLVVAGVLVMVAGWAYKVGVGLWTGSLST